LSNLTPMMQQYWDIKRDHADAILFFRLGDFYEMFFDDAQVAAEVLGLALTGRDAGGGKRAPMCGIPFHAADNYIARLIKNGYKVAICEQVEDPKVAKGLVERRVVRIITAGTFLDNEALEEKRNNFLVALAKDDNCFGLAVLDAGTGELMVTEICANDSRQVIDELSRLQPVEGLLSPDVAADHDLVDQIAAICPFPRSNISPESWLPDRAENVLIEVWGTGFRQRFACDSLTVALCAAGAALTYLKKTQQTVPVHVTELVPYVVDAFMHLDNYTRRNLELTRSMREDKVRGSLLHVLDLTVTAMGGRLLRQWLEQPLCRVASINQRLDAVAELMEKDARRTEVRKWLRQIPDLERLLGKIVYGTATPKDLASLRNGCIIIPHLTELVSTLPFSKQICTSLDPLSHLTEKLCTTLVDDPPVSARDGGLIRPGCNAEIDRLHKLTQGGRQWVAELETRERERTGIKSLKVGYNKVFGYYIEVTKANIGNVPADYIRRQTLVAAERYVTPELKEREAEILGAQERLTQLEYQVFTELCQVVADEAALLRSTANAIAQLDVLACLAEVATRYNYVRPVVDNSDVIHLQASRHPVVERLRPSVPFVANDVYLDNSSNRFILLTGPNMAGKSTYIRQVALSVLMAQVGSFVPADKARVGIVDRIFTRVGASDDLAAGDSTFMVEMRECEIILREATNRSLVILDEVGRGTSTLDGLSLAQAITEYLATEVGCKTLFSTHYHELTSLATEIACIKNYNMAMAEQLHNLIFLRKVVPGGSDRSYGIQVARLAGLPEKVLERATCILASLTLQKETAAADELNSPLLSKLWRDFLELDVRKIPPLELQLQVAAIQHKLRCEVEKVAQDQGVN
jgi:DNA mismatch repair protein MutS